MFVFQLCCICIYIVTRAFSTEQFEYFPEPKTIFVFWIYPLLQYKVEKFSQNSSSYQLCVDVYQVLQ